MKSSRRIQSMVIICIAALTFGAASTQGRQSFSNGSDNQFKDISGSISCGDAYSTIVSNAPLLNENYYLVFIPKWNLNCASHKHMEIISERVHMLNDLQQKADSYMNAKNYKMASLYFERSMAFYFELVTLQKNDHKVILPHLLDTVSSLISIYSRMQDKQEANTLASWAHTAYSENNNDKMYISHASVPDSVKIDAALDRCDKEMYDSTDRCTGSSDVYSLVQCYNRSKKQYKACTDSAHAALYSRERVF